MSKVVRSFHDEDDKEDSLLRELADLMTPRKTAISYTLKVKLDVGTFTLPIHITREGNLTLPTAN